MTPTREYNYNVPLAVFRPSVEDTTSIPLNDDPDFALGCGACGSCVPCTCVHVH